MVIGAGKSILAMGSKTGGVGSVNCPGLVPIALREVACCLLGLLVCGVTRVPRRQLR